MYNKANNLLGHSLTPGEALRRGRENTANTMSKLHPKVKASVLKIPHRFRPTYAKTMANEGSPRKAIKSLCQKCAEFKEVKATIGSCRNLSCPVWHYRPYQPK